MSFIFADAWLITMNERREVLEGASVCVEGDRIAAVGTRQQLQQRFPTFDYIGNATPDLPALAHSRNAYIANPSPGLRARLKSGCLSNSKTTSKSPCCATL